VTDKNSDIPCFWFWRHPWY